LASILLLITGLFTGGMLGYAFETPMVVTRLFSYTLISASVLCLLFGVDLMDPRSALARMCTTRVFSYLGRISYGIYLYHFPVFYAFSLFPAKQESSLGTIGFAVLITIAIAAVSYQLIEKPILSLKSRFT